MITISRCLEEIIAQNSFLEFGLSNKLLNLSQVARFIRPMIEARSKKEVQEAAILMSLSRLQTKVAGKKPKGGQDFKIDDIHIQSDLTILVLDRSQENHERIGQLYAKLQKLRSYITITEGLSEITVIISSDHLKLAEQVLKGRATHKNKDAAAVRVRFPERYLSAPGFLFLILQQLAFQGINLLEVASTRTEFIMYVESKDVQLAFETLFGRFGRR